MVHNFGYDQASTPAGRTEGLAVGYGKYELQHLIGRGGMGDVWAARHDADNTDVALKLADGWRRRDDLSWRASTWGLRREALGGMFLKPVDAKDPAKGLRIEHVGRFAPHDGAKRAGFASVAEAMGDLRYISAVYKRARRRRA
jgi:hypothetical protein